MEWKPYFYDILGLRLRQARRSAGLTQTQVGEMLGKPRSYVSECERAKRQVDLIEFVELVAIYDKPAVYCLDFLLSLWEEIE